MSKTSNLFDLLQDEGEEHPKQTKTTTTTTTSSLKPKPKPMNNSVVPSSKTPLNKIQPTSQENRNKFDGGLSVPTIPERDKFKGRPKGRSVRLDANGEPVGRVYDRRSGTGRPIGEVKKGGSGRGNWGSENVTPQEAATDLQQTTGATATGEETGEPGATAPLEEKIKQIGLDEYLKAQQDGIVQLNPVQERKPGEGESSNKEWDQFEPIQSSKSRGSTKTTASQESKKNGGKKNVIQVELNNTASSGQKSYKRGGNRNSRPTTEQKKPLPNNTDFPALA
eukprot:gene8627-10617_t